MGRIAYLYKCPYSLNSCSRKSNIILQIIENKDYHDGMTPSFSPTHLLPNNSEAKISFITKI